MNIQEMQALCERLLVEGVNPLTPIVVVNKEVLVCDEGEGRPSETIEQYSLEEIEDANLVMSQYRPDGSPKMAVMMPVVGPALVLTDLGEVRENIEGFVEYLKIPRLENLATVYGRANRVHPPTDFVLQPPIFNGPFPAPKPVTRQWFIAQVQSNCHPLYVQGGRGRNRHHSKPQYESGIRACVSGDLPVDYLTTEVSGFFQSVDAYGNNDGPRYLVINTKRFSYVVDGTTLEIKVSTMGAPWQVWREEDTVSDLHSDIEHIFEVYI